MVSEKKRRCLNVGKKENGIYGEGVGKELNLIKIFYINVLKI